MTSPKTVQRALEDIGILLGFTDKGRFKAQAYERGAEVVAGLASELGAVIANGRLTDIEGIGASLSKTIVEIWQTGTSSLLERLRAENPPGAAELARVPGLTPKRIKALSEHLGVRSADDLRTACADRKVRTLPGFGEKTELKLCEALAAYERQETAPTRLLLRDALDVAGTIPRALSSVDGVRAVELAGEARRGVEVIGDLELVITASADDALAATRAAVYERLRDLPLVLRFDEDTDRAALAQGIGLQLHFTKPSHTAVTLLLATGPDAHVAALEARAKKDSTSLAARALESESALYRELGLHPVPPELRDLPSAVELSARDDFADLIEARDIRGMVHCHTTHSDGRNSVEEMARAAAALGMEYITITDHSPSAHYARGVTLERLEAQWEEIRDAEQRVGIRILRGTESDILIDGQLDYPPDVLARFDVVIASIHSRMKLSREQMTARLVACMKLPIFKIWGHALGRLLLSRDPIDCDVEAVLDALAASRGAIEVNGDPHRLDLAPPWIRKARERNIPFVLSVDAHSTQGLGVLPFAATMGRRGGLRKREVLNTLGPDAFLDQVRPAAR